MSNFVLETETTMSNGLVVSTFVDEVNKRYYSVVTKDGSTVRTCHHRPGTRLEETHTYAVKVAKKYAEMFM